MDQLGTQVWRLLAVGCGGFLGAVTRFGINEVIRRRFPTEFPLGTLTVNMIGCLLIGGLMALFRFGWDTPGPRLFFVTPAWLTENTRLLLVTGMLGSLTTFSTLSYETLELLRRAETSLALANVAVSLIAGIVFVWLGHTFMDWLIR